MRCLAVPLALATLAVAIGCGPSIRRVHRSQVYFERCYAADLDPAVPVHERHACWQQWMVHYQVGQPPDRIDYVRERLLRLDPERSEIVSLATGGSEDSVPLDESAPAIAAEAAIVSATVAGEEPISQPAIPATDEAQEEAAVTVVEATGPQEVRPVSEPPPEPSDVPPARERRLQRTPPIPRTDSPRCAEACRPGWEACLAGCGSGDVRACHRSCRLQHRTCARACY